MRKIWNTLREVEWFAVLAMLLLATATLLAVLIATLVITPLLWVLAVVFGFAAVVCAIFSYRT